MNNIMCSRGGNYFLCIIEEKNLTFTFESLNKLQPAKSVYKQSGSYSFYRLKERVPIVFHIRIQLLF